MNKQMPNSKVKYRFSRRSDPDLARLCALSANEFTNFSVQTRTWIYSDKADFAAVTKHLLFPKPTAGQYLDCAYDVARQTNANFGAEYKGCIDPSLLFGAGRARPQAAEWYAQMCDKHAAESLAGTLKSQSAAVAALLATTTDNRVNERVAATFRVLAGSPHPDVAIAAAELLKSVPADRRTAIVLKGALFGLPAMLLSKDKAVCTAALDLVDSYQDRAAYPYLSDLAKSEAAPELKARAAALCKALG